MTQERRTMQGSFLNMRPYIKTLIEASEALTATHTAMRLALEALADTVAEAETQFIETQPAETPPTRAPPPTRTGPLTTAELAAEVSRVPASIRKRLSATGSYYGLVPAKLGSGRLLWPSDSVARLMIAWGASYADHKSICITEQLARRGRRRVSRGAPAEVETP
jgi:hypothetical protein